MFGFREVHCNNSVAFGAAVFVPLGSRTLLGDAITLTDIRDMATYIPIRPKIIGSTDELDPDML